MPEICATRNLGIASFRQEICYSCKKPFECSTATRYRANVNGRIVFFCSYKCFREIDRKKREEDQQKVERQNQDEAYKNGYGWKKINSVELQEEKLLARIELCEMKIRQWYTAYLLAERGSTKRRKSRDSMRSWETKKKRAETELSELRRTTGKGEANGADTRKSV